MKKCNYCNVNILDDNIKCPLCNLDLTTTDKKNVHINTYPQITLNFHKYNNVIRILLFLSFLGSAILMSINYITTKDFLWSLICIAGILYLWIAIPFSLKNNINTTSKIVGQTIFAILIELALDYIIGYSGWAVNYAIPSTIVISNICMLSLTYINNKPYDNYFIYQLLLLLISFAPIILYFIGITNILWPALISTICAIITIIVIAIIYNKTLLEELKKRFHF